MAVYEVITPTGEAYEVEGPEGATKAQLVAAIQRTQLAEPQYKPRGIDYIQELPKGIASGIAGILESAALGGATLLPEKYEAPVREKIQAVGDVAQSFVTPDTGLEQAIPRKFGEALGSFTGILGTSLIPGVGIPAAGALAVGAGAGAGLIDGIPSVVSKDLMAFCIPNILDKRSRPDFVDFISNCIASFAASIFAFSFLIFFGLGPKRNPSFLSSSSLSLDCKSGKS